MGRSLWLIAVLLALGACTSTSEAPAPSPTATSSPEPQSKDDQSTICEWDRLPGAMLSFGQHEQREAKVATNWHADYCSVDAHPSFTVPLPETALEIPIGTSPQLSFSIKPESVSGYAWRPDFSLAEDPEFDRVQVQLDDLRGSTRVALDFEAVASQDLNLTTLPPGDYAIEIFAGWEDGSAGFAFRVEILEP